MSTLPLGARSIGSPSGVPVSTPGYFTASNWNPYAGSRGSLAQALLLTCRYDAILRRRARRAILCWQFSAASRPFLNTLAVGHWYSLPTALLAAQLLPYFTRLADPNVEPEIWTVLLLINCHELLLKQLLNYCHYFIYLSLELSNDWRWTSQTEGHTRALRCCANKQRNFAKLIK